MTSDRPDRQRVPADRMGEGNEESLVRGGLRGIALVTAATIGLAIAAAAVALVVSLFY